MRATEQPAELWDAGDPITGLANVIRALAAPQIPVVIGFDVVQSFDSPDSNGFVRFRPGRAKVCATDPPTGGCVVTLPQTAPKGPGGFLIIKISWGCVGDGGHSYLPATWVRTFVHSARAVGDVEASAPLPDQPFDPSYPFDYRPVPPSVRIVQPAVGERFVDGQGVPLAVDGVDFQYDRYVLLGQTRWSSDRQGELATGVNAIATLTEGTYVITATYTGKTGAVATATTTVVVGPRPADLPRTPYFFDFTIVPGNQCPVPSDFSCILGFGQGQRRGGRPPHCRRQRALVRAGADHAEPAYVDRSQRREPGEVPHLLAAVRRTLHVHARGRGQQGPARGSPPGALHVLVRQLSRSRRESSSPPTA